MSANDDDDSVPLVRKISHEQPKKVTFSYQMVEDEGEEEIGDDKSEGDSVLGDQTVGVVVAEGHNITEPGSADLTSDPSPDNGGGAVIVKSVSETVQKIDSNGSLADDDKNGGPVTHIVDGDTAGDVHESDNREDIGKLEERVLTLLANVVQTDSEKSLDSDEVSSEPPKSHTEELDRIAIDLVNAQEVSHSYENIPTSMDNDLESGQAAEITNLGDDPDGITNAAFVDETVPPVDDNGDNSTGREIGTQANLGKGNYRSTLQQKSEVSEKERNDDDGITELDDGRKDMGTQVFIGRGNYRSTLQKQNTVTANQSAAQGVSVKPYTSPGQPGRQVNKQKQQQSLPSGGDVLYHHEKPHYKANDNRAMKNVRMWIVGGVVIIAVIAVVLGLTFFTIDRKGLLS